MTEDKATVTYQPDMAGDTGMTGTVPVDSNAYINGATVTVLENVGNLSLSGYVLLGWTTKAPSAEGLRLHTSDQYIDFVSANDLYMANRTFTMGTGNVTLYAVWGVDSNHNGKEDWRDNNQFFVVYDANGGTGALPSPEVLEAGVLSVTTADRPAGLLRDGYVQVGWTVNQNGAGAPGELTQEFILTEPRKITISGSEYLYKAFLSTHAIQLGDPNPVILYALWAEDTNRNGQPDYEEDRYTVSYETVADGAAAVSLPRIPAGISPAPPSHWAQRQLLQILQANPWYSWAGARTALRPPGSMPGASRITASSTSRASSSGWTAQT